MTDREVMQMALDSLRLCTALPTWPSIIPTIEALRTALAQPEMVNGMTEKETGQTMSVIGLSQPEPEPVAWWHDMGDVVDLNISGHGTPLYTAPPKKEWVGLTKDEVNNWELPEFPTVYEFAKFVAAKLKDKNNG